MVLIGARPGHGKMLLALEILAQAPSTGRAGFFFTLDYHWHDVFERLKELGFRQTGRKKGVVVNTSDDI